MGETTPLDDMRVWLTDQLRKSDRECTDHYNRAETARARSMILRDAIDQAEKLGVGR